MSHKILVKVLAFLKRKNELEEEDKNKIFVVILPATDVKIVGVIRSRLDSGCNSYEAASNLANSLRENNPEVFVTYRVIEDIHETVIGPQHQPIKAKRKSERIVVKTGRDSACYYEYESNDRAENIF